MGNNTHKWYITDDNRKLPANDYDIWYHGTTVKFDKPNLQFSKNRKDFGRGFYLAKSKRHSEKLAEQMSITVTNKGQNQGAIVYAYAVPKSLQHG